MLRLSVLVLTVVAVALATPPVSRTRAQIEEFRRFLESTQTDDGSKLLSYPAADLANAEELSGKFEGDILLDDWMVEDMVEQYAAGRNAYTLPATKWPNNVVVWELADGEFSPQQIEAIWEGVRDIERHTCLRFRYRQPSDTVYVSVTGMTGGCYAHVGYSRTRGVHTLNLQRNAIGVSCFRHGTIVHEWMHILGFLHMQSTWNRDEYVRIETDNLIAGTENNFFIYTSDQVSNLDIEYDYVSCLHYGPYAFTNNGEKTIVALKEHTGIMGQRGYITNEDWLRINRHYNCPGAWN